MRLLSLEVAGFRGFATEQSFDLDADAVVVVGANGNGKTSLFDGVLWALSGRVPRLGRDDKLLACRFSDTGQARVVLRLKRTDGPSPVTVTRIFDGTETKVSVETPEGIFRGPEAEGHLIRLVWKDAASASNPPDALATVLTRSVYLQQDLVRQFIDSVTEQDRFTAVSELVGAGRVTELQAELERAKAAWTKTTNSRDAELQPLRGRLSSMEARLAELKSRSAISDTGVDEAAWAAWWEQLRAAGLKVSPVPMGSREAPGAIDAAIKQLDAVRRAAERRQQSLEALSRDVAGIAAKPKPDLTPLQSKVARAKEQLDEASGKVSIEQGRLVELRRLQADLKEKSAQLRTLAVLALKHLGEKCPVCDQEYDAEGTRHRLELMATAGDASVGSAPDVDLLPELLAILASRERELAAAESELRGGEQTANEFEVTELAVQRRLTEFALTPSTGSDLRSSVEGAAIAARQEVEVLFGAQKTGEAFALRLSQAGDQATIQELQREIETAREKLQRDDKELVRRTATGAQAQRVIEALREAASRVVTERVKEIEPLLSEIYSRIDVHPAFRVVRLLASVVRGRGQLSTVIRDPISEIESDSPGTVLSSSQMNALAVCAFLSLNLGISRPPFEAVMLDDPLQSLDDINLLGLVDLLRRTKDQRQLCVSTHDARFGDLLARKLRPRVSQQRTVVIELDGWSRRGPTVTTRDVKSDPAPIRLVAS
ncbi:MAG TPA: AAA family ATPase [Vicinamibacterales bacterium]|nr:AAA family ATPase [Vicinamibacterales bacterium]